MDNLQTRIGDKFRLAQQGTTKDTGNGLTKSEHIDTVRRDG